MTVLARSLPPARSMNRATFDVLTIVAGSLVVAALAQISIPLPFTPVPITGQTLGVLLVGASLGAVRGGLSLALYLLQGALGAPFFADGGSGLEVLKASSATGGYLWGFVAAAAVSGWLAERRWDRRIGSAIGAMFLGQLVIYLFGVPWLAAALGKPAEEAMSLGLYPFIVGDVVKLLLAAGLLPGAWRLVGRER